MTEFPEESLRDQLQNATIITVADAAVQLGPDIPDGFTRKIVRVHVPSPLPAADVQASLFLGSTNDPALAANLIDVFTVVSGNPDFQMESDNLAHPLITVRPDETPAVDADDLDKLFIQRLGAGNNVRMSITFYDER